ncbi:uncharacterized protein LOC143039813 [Oratosquilla oratoria]|uniref:uncharacterized protein LOC143039813 n=1 Tax=Oratosquilla oratoria TaxID=337810 RepID=UPI003F77200A
MTMTTPPYAQPLGYQQSAQYNAPGYGFPPMYAQGSYGYPMGAYPTSQCPSPPRDATYSGFLHHPNFSSPSFSPSPKDYYTAIENLYGLNNNARNHGYSNTLTTPRQQAMGLRILVMASLWALHGSQVEIHWSPFRILNEIVRF